MIYTYTLNYTGLRKRSSNGELCNDSSISEYMHLAPLPTETDGVYGSSVSMSGIPNTLEDWAAAQVRTELPLV
jgi:hypothetical protein